MNYAFEIDTPANTSKSAPLITRRRIGAGTIRQFVIYFPPGGAGLLHVRIRHGNHVLLPYNQESDITGDNVKFDLPEDIKIDRQTWQITIETWNTDDTFNHKLYIIISVLEEVRPPPWVVSLLNLFFIKQKATGRAALSGEPSGISAWASKLFGGLKT